VKDSIRKLARTLSVMSCGHPVDAEKVEGLVRSAIRETIDAKIQELIHGIDGMESAIDAEIDRRLLELTRNFSVVAADDHNGHQHYVKLTRGIR